MTPQELFRKDYANQKWNEAMDSDAMIAATATVLAVIAGMGNVSNAELNGARQALSILPTLHLPDPPPPKNFLESPLRHDLESVQRGGSQHASKKKGS